MLFALKIIYIRFHVLMASFRSRLKCMSARLEIQLIVLNRMEGSGWEGRQIDIYNESDRQTLSKCNFELLHDECNSTFIDHNLKATQASRFHATKIRFPK